MADAAFLKATLGIYKHFKGGEYQVLGIGKDSETLEELVIYRSTDPEKPELMIASRSMFEKYDSLGMADAAILFKTRLGVYKHFKGGEYQTLGIGKHSETLEELVIYQSTDPEKPGLWVRPRPMFEEYVRQDGAQVRRFTYLRPEL